MNSPPFSTIFLKSSIFLNSIGSRSFSCSNTVYFPNELPSLHLSPNIFNICFFTKSLQPAVVQYNGPIPSSVVGSLPSPEILSYLQVPGVVHSSFKLVATSLIPLLIPSLISSESKSIADCPGLESYAPHKFNFSFAIFEVPYPLSCVPIATITIGFIPASVDMS